MTSSARFGRYRNDVPDSAVDILRGCAAHCDDRKAFTVHVDGAACECTVPRQVLYLLATCAGETEDRLDAFIRLKSALESIVAGKLAAGTASLSDLPVKVELHDILAWMKKDG